MLRQALFCLFVVATPAFAHELWLEPTDFQISTEAKLEARIVNGQEFKGSELSYIPQRVALYMIFSGERALPVQMRAGDRPGLLADSLGDGLHIVAYQTTISTITYDDWEDFSGFVAHKDLAIDQDAHVARLGSDTGFTEAYYRFSKTLIGVGSAQGEDRRTGLETEIVALENPYTDDMTDGFTVQLFYRNEMRGNEQIEVFDRAPDGTVSVSTVRTDPEGIADIVVLPGHDYMLDAVVLRQPSERVAASTGAFWETLWANLTFSIPH